MAYKVLSALNTAKTQYYHFKAIIIAGMGLFTDSYDLFCMPPITRLIGRRYYDNPDPNKRYEVPIPISSTMVAVSLLGTVIGKLVFGHLGDLVGRRRVYGLALMLMVLSSIGCEFSICTSQTCVLWSLGFFRFLLGVGIGGDYPLSATIMSEFLKQEDERSVHSGGVLHAGVGDTGELDCHDGGLHHLQRWDKTAQGSDATGGRPGMEAHTHHWCHSGCYDILLAYDDARTIQLSPAQLQR